MEICLTNSELCLGERSISELLNDIWYHIWDWLIAHPNGHPRETEREYQLRIDEQLALHAALNTVRVKIREANEEPLVAAGLPAPEEIYTPEVAGI